MADLEVKKTEWDLTPLLNSDNDKRIEEIKKILQENNLNFINKWKKGDDYLLLCVVWHALQFFIARPVMPI